MKRSKGYRVVAPDRYLRVLDEPVAVVIALEGETLVRSARARRLVEGDRPAVIYVPREDVDTTRLVPSGRTFHCRWKGDAAYFHLDLRDRTLENVVWGYPGAPDALAVLRDLVAFDPATFDVLVDADPSGDARAGDEAGTVGDGVAGGAVGDGTAEGEPGTGDAPTVERSA